jgi:hypothetical protein
MAKKMSSEIQERFAPASGSSPGGRRGNKRSPVDQNTTVAKTGRSAEDRRLTRLTKICLALLEATRRDMGRHAAFLVGKKTFAYF